MRMGAGRKNCLAGRRSRRGRKPAALAGERHRVCLESACRFAEHRLNPQEVIGNESRGSAGNCTLANVSRNFPADPAVFGRNLIPSLPSPHGPTLVAANSGILCPFLGVLVVTFTTVTTPFPLLPLV